MRISLITLCLLVTVCFTCLSSTVEVSQDNPSSIHHIQQLQHSGDPVGNHTRSITPQRNRTLTHTVYGWYPWWMGDAYLNLEWDLLSHVSFFSIEVDATGAITNDNNWPENWSGLITTAQNAGVPLTLTCTLFSSSSINTLIGDPVARNNLITNLIAECQSGGAEGVNIDFEGSNLDPQNLVTFMAELRAGFDAAIPGAHISMASPAVDWTGSFDYDMLAAQCDDLIAMCYDYHWSGGNPGPVSPLTAGSVWSQWCVDWTVNDYTTYGTPPEKMAVGVPYYGFDWLVTGDPSTYPADDGAGDANPRVYSYIQNNHSGYTKYWDSHSQTPWYHYYDSSDPRQVWYDDATSLSLKYDLVLDENLDGIGIWALGYDDGYTELWDEIEAHFTSNVTPTPAPTATPTITPIPTVYTSIIDNQDAGCTVTGEHWVLGSYGETYGPDKLYSSTGIGEGDATFSTWIPLDAFRVTAWVNDAEYATEAHYTIHHATGSTDITCSQFSQGGGWCVDLGQYVFNGDSSVVINDDAGTGIVVADAIRWEAVPGACPRNGDVNFDGNLSAGDAQLAFYIVLGTYTPYFAEECAADCNGDYSVTAGDAQMIFLAALGIESCRDEL